MIATNSTQFREHMKRDMDRVSDDCEPLVITRKKDRNLVLISEEMYNNLVENIYVMGDKANYNWLMESKKQAEEGRLITQERADD
ncbi:MAG: type II toxin-antitoxin system Phd/YefM family antitoxin [Lachnospiraceae bacterium]|nr:type II toxin-antitoxin system Phd/YefM family antitoxin [Lachnospiraceae bacterium]